MMTLGLPIDPNRKAKLKIRSRSTRDILSKEEMGDEMDPKSKEAEGMLSIPSLKNQNQVLKIPGKNRLSGFAPDQAGEESKEERARRTIDQIDQLCSGTLSLGIAFSFSDIKKAGKLGQGASGSVLKAIHKPTMTRLAIKVIYIYIYIYILDDATSWERGSE